MPQAFNILLVLQTISTVIILRFTKKYLPISNHLNQRSNHLYPQAYGGTFELPNNICQTKGGLRLAACQLQHLDRTSEMLTPESPWLRRRYFCSAPIAKTPIIAHSITVHLDWMGIYHSPLVPICHPLTLSSIAASSIGDSGRKY